jgi:hypothetical protein
VARARGPGMPVVRSPASDRRPGRTFGGRASGGHAGAGLPRAGWRGSEPLRATEQHPAPVRAHPPKALAGTLPEACDGSLSHLTTPHKLQAEACFGKPTRAGWAVCPSGNPMAEACQLHAVVRPRRTAVT